MNDLTIEDVKNATGYKELEHKVNHLQDVVLSLQGITMNLQELMIKIMDTLVANGIYDKSKYRADN